MVGGPQQYSEPPPSVRLPAQELPPSVSGIKPILLGRCLGPFATGATPIIVLVIKIAIFATIVLWGCKFTNARICKETFYLNISELHIAMATSGKTHFWSVQCRFNVNLGSYSEQPRLAPYISLCLTLPVLSATSTSRPNLTHISYTFTRSFFSLISS